MDAESAKSGGLACSLDSATDLLVNQFAFGAA